MGRARNLQPGPSPESIGETNDLPAQASWTCKNMVQFRRPTGWLVHTSARANKHTCTEGAELMSYTDDLMAPRTPGVPRVAHCRQKRPVAPEELAQGLKCSTRCLRTSVMSSLKCFSLETRTHLLIATQPFSRHYSWVSRMSRACLRYFGGSSSVDHYLLQTDTWG